MSHRLIKRLQNEIREIKNNTHLNIEFVKVTDKFDEWQVKLIPHGDSIYNGEEFLLNFKFSDQYPFDSPQVTFTGDHIPEHPHIYSNGHICLSILAEDWSPAMTVESVCVSVVSMLNSCPKKELPPDNDRYVRTCSKDPKKTRWWFHDDTV